MSEESKAVVAMFEVAGMTAEHYDQIIKGLEEAGVLNPKERPYHVAASTGDGWLVIDTWDSVEALNQFAQTLMPIIQKIGGPMPQPRVYPVYNIIKR